MKKRLSLFASSTSRSLSEKKYPTQHKRRLKSFLILISLLCSAFKIFSQVPTVNGPSSGTTGQTSYYTVSYNIMPPPSATIAWAITGGEIVYQVNSAQNASCVVRWYYVPGVCNVKATLSINGSSSNRTVIVTGTCQSANAGNDITICSGTPTTIGTPGYAGYIYSWSPTTGLSNANIAQPTASPTQTTTYTVTMSPANLFQNGDFESGLTGFNTDYGVFPNGDGSCGQGVWGSIAVVTDPRSLGPQWCSKSDHSPTGDKMLVVDASCGLNKRIWYETVTVGQNFTYNFSGWASSNGYDFNQALYIPRLRVRINGTDVLTNFSVPWSPGGCSQWLQFTASWNSGSSTTALIEIIDDNRNDQGNDFSIDDLSFANCPTTTDQVTVAVGSAVPIVTPSGPIAYYNQYETPNSVTLTCTTGATYQWYKNNVAISGATNQSYIVNFSGSNIYTEYYKCVNSCGTSNIVTFNYHGCISPADYPVPIPQTYCVSTLPVTLTAPILTGAQYSWWALNNPTVYSFSNFSGNTCKLNASSPYPNEGIYTKSDVSNGEQIFMFYTVVGNPGCKARKELAVTEMIPLTQTQLSPNPSSSWLTLRNRTPIEEVEIFNVLGSIVKRIKGNGSSTLLADVSRLKPGVYSCRIMTARGVETLKFVIQR